LEIAVTLKAAIAANRALDDENIHRPNGRRHQQANADTGKDKLKGGENDLCACLQS
jgi:hypothetical protein